MSQLRIAALATLLLAASLLASVVAPPKSTSTSPSPTASAIADASASPTASPAATASPDATPGSSATPAPTRTPAATTTPSPTASATPKPTATPAGTSLLTLLAKLAVTGETNHSTYDRARFRHWIDADGDGCDTRDEVLIAEAVKAPTVGAGCTISGGSWYSAYDEITTTNPSSFDVDHMVPLKEAWVSGAAAWSDARRSAFANDLDVPYALIAVSATSNRSKSDQDPGQWLPPLTGYRCTYIANWIALKVRWTLSVDSDEYFVLYRYAEACPAFPGTVTPLP